ncbi:hypothetical protein G5C51_08040 [Streptomyces sp. A7024]|uniref:Uncharacterized protein n=1 Tax=Streptomyces coryli TaxID=1128680 RepID=A0A6G4TXL8_9ACTN|nr:hypothetical protein [Streptomyces coryli]NGN63858.1 hypothetical protein [Streptomyces coryli]
MHADAFVAELAKEEEKARHRAVYGEYYRGRGRSPGHHIEPEICAEVDKEFKPGRDLVRKWCGTEAVEAFEELKELRTEVVRIGKLMEEAIQALRTAGHDRIAEGFERRLGVPMELLQHASTDDTGA